jgi:hypothetical protein
MNGEAFLKTRRVYVWASRYLDTHGQSLPSRLYEEYSPVRCLGDALVHRMITILSQTELTEGDRYRVVTDLYNSLDEEGQRLWEICWKYIRHTLKSWLDTGLPVPPVPMT